jgi:type III secretory pathway component EscT
MSHRTSESLIAALIRVGLLLALVILLMAENAQAQPASHHSLQLPTHAAGTRANGTA